MHTESCPVVQRAPAGLGKVRRRSIRQNYEPAKTHLSQSLRIRNPEVEVSRLLSDNLDLWQAERQVYGGDVV
ncbi:hypothetical protein Tdes44962_MAKER06107 [Teratosphaeria destructans]|uniref:Shugoshin N-terminal coiled-coil domain-containing protein n=1 Tax=Teratosphaeria destructans TaxID=418781 RepID=A0A9W7SIA6_9PEZI|nr:hypothetical protein Tdes44962_MAKER06107 [Teratosphaeria destructans]